MNILYTITVFPPAMGGAQLHLQQLFQQLESPMLYILPHFGTIIVLIGYWVLHYLLQNQETNIFIIKSQSKFSDYQLLKKFNLFHL